jgi:uncharacterized protein (DUF58 family)
MSLRDRLARRFEARLIRRAPLKENNQVSSKRIYIFLTKEGGLICLLIAALFLAGVNYANNLVLGLCFFLSSVLVVSLHFTHAQINHVTLKVLSFEPAEAGRNNPVMLEISARGSSRPSIELGWVNHAPTRIALGSKPLRVTLPLTHTRGISELPALKVSSDYPLGLIRSWSYVRFTQTSWAWPSQVRASIPEGVIGGASVFAQMSTKSSASEDFDQLKPYVAGESQARISWRHYAQRSELLSRHFTADAGVQMVLDYDEFQGVRHEARLRQLSFLVHKLSNQGHRFALKLSDDQLAMGGGATHRDSALKLLALMKPWPDSKDIDSRTTASDKSVQQAVDHRAGADKPSERNPAGART